jgi:hypothetical protein
VVHDRITGDNTRSEQFLHRQPQRDPAARDRRAARPAIGLDHVAVDHDLPFAKRLPVHARTQRTTDKPLNFLRSSRLLARSRLTPGPRIGGTRQHPVFRRHPALPGILQKRRGLVLDRGGTQHMRFAHLDQARALCMLHHAGFD